LGSEAKQEISPAAAITGSDPLLGCGVTALEGDEAGDVPTALVAVTVKVYA
jgi:hypothetical protein